MENYELIVDEKVSVWKRSYITVAANSLEEAVKECIECGSDLADEVTNSNFIDETEELIPPDKEATIEVMDRSYNVIGSNL